MQGMVAGKKEAEESQDKYGRKTSQIFWVRWQHLSGGGQASISQETFG